MLRASVGDWHSDWSRDAEVLWRIDRGEETVKILEDLLKSDKPEPAIGAAGILGSKSKTAVPLLGKILAHKDAKVRARAVVALVRLGPDAWPDRLARLDGVLGELDARGERVVSIDLRFRDQVVLTPRPWGSPAGPARGPAVAGRRRAAGDSATLVMPAAAGLERR